jgi:hypothetical protein
MRFLSGAPSQDVISKLENNQGIFVDAPKLDLFGAMHAARWYCSTADRFEMIRPTWAQWTSEGKV